MPPEDGEINVDLGAELADLLDAGRSGDADPEDVQRASPRWSSPSSRSSAS